MERSVWSDGHSCWDWDSWVHMRCSGIEFLAEVHRFDTFTSQRRTDGRTRARLSGSDYQLDDLICCCACFRHLEEIGFEKQNLKGNLEIILIEARVKVESSIRNLVPEALVRVLDENNDGYFCEVKFTLFIYSLNNGRNSLALLR